MSSAPLDLQICVGLSRGSADNFESYGGRAFAPGQQIATGTLGANGQLAGFLIP